MAAITTTPDELVQRLSDPKGFKKIFGWFGGKAAKVAHELFSTADQRGVARSYTLDYRVYERNGNGYYIKAIGTRGDLTAETLARLTQAAKVLPLGTVRYEGTMAATLPEPLGSVLDANDINSLSVLDEGILVYPVTVLDKKQDATFAVWAHQGGEWYVYPIENSRI
jgi:hypothetical protein